MLRVDLSSLNSLIDRKQGKLEDAARPAAQAAAQVVYDEVKRNVAGLGRKTGNLERSIYQVFSKDNSSPGRATYHISYNERKAPHGHLIEFGHIQRYQFYKGNDGEVRPMVRPGMEGHPRPKRHDSRAVKDAYYVLRDIPLQIPAKPFIRPATRVFPQAVEAARVALLKAINES